MGNLNVNNNPTKRRDSRHSSSMGAQFKCEGKRSSIIAMQKIRHIEPFWILIHYQAITINIIYSIDKGKKTVTSTYHYGSHYGLKYKEYNNPLAPQQRMRKSKNPNTLNYLGGRGSKQVAYTWIMIHLWPFKFQEWQCLLSLTNLFLNQLKF